jgi:hypothetical protein
MDRSRKTSELLPLLDRINKKWQAVSIQLINHTRKFDEVVKSSEKYHGLLQPLMQWFDKIEGRVTTLSPVAVQPQDLIEQLSEQKVNVKLKNIPLDIFNICYLNLNHNFS